MSPDHEKILQELWERSVDWAQNAASKCSQADELRLAWFGNNDTATKQHVCDHMNEIVGVLGNLHLQDDDCSSSSDSTLMCVTQPKRDDNKDRYIIYVCPGFYKSWALRSKDSSTSKYGVLVHEASHHFDTEDEELQGKRAYGAARSFALARKSTKRALNNADNYMWFAYYMKRNGVTGPKQRQQQKQGPCAGKTDVYGNTLSVSAQCQKQVAPTEVTVVFFDKDEKVMKSPEIGDDPQTESFKLDFFSAQKKQDLEEIAQIELWYEVAGSYFSGSTAWGKGNGAIETQRIDLKRTPPDVLPCQLKFHTKVESKQMTPKTSILTFPTDMSFECRMPVRPVKFKGTNELDTAVKAEGKPVKHMVLKSGEYFRFFDQKTYTFVAEVDGQRLELSQQVPNPLKDCTLSLTPVDGKNYLREAEVSCTTVEVKDVTLKLDQCKAKEQNLPTQITKGHSVSVAQLHRDGYPNCQVALYGYVNEVFGYKKFKAAR